MTVEDLRTRVKELLRGKFSPQIISSGPSNLVNTDIKNMLLSPFFVDEYMTTELEKAFDDYLARKAVMILGPAFENQDDYSKAVSHWIIKSKDIDISNPVNKGLFELLLVATYSENKINYITYDDDNNIILKKIDPIQSKVAGNILNKAISEAVKEGTVGDLFADTFLGTLISQSYTLDDFKLKLSEKISDKLISSRDTGFQVQTSLSPEFLGETKDTTLVEDLKTVTTAAFSALPTVTAAFAAFDLIGDGEGPLSIKEDGANAYLSKEYDSEGVNHSTTIPVDKLSKFKQLTDWDTKASIFGKQKDISYDSTQNPNVAIYYTDEQIDKFADALRGKDITKNPFNFYTGEFYDSWGIIFDSDYWTAFADQVGETNGLMWDATKSLFVFEDGAEPTGDYDGVKQTPIWTGSLLEDFDAIDDTPVEFPDINTNTLALGATAAAVKWGVTKINAWRMLQVLNSNIPAGSTFRWTQGPRAVRAFGLLTKAGKVGRYTTLLNNATKAVRFAGSIKGALIALNLAIYGSFGYSLYQASVEQSQSARLETLVLEKYQQFFSDAVVALAGGGWVGQKFRDAMDDEFLKKVLAIFALDKDVERRVRLWNRFSFELGRDENFLDPNNLDAAMAAVYDATGKAFADIPLPEITKLTDEQIQDRQKFYKQCALMMNLSKLAIPYENHIIGRQGSILFDGPDRTKPFGGRFWRATSENKEQLITNIFSSEKSQYLFEVPPHIMTQLVPKFRLYKVLNDSNGKLQRTEFIFPMHTDLSRSKNFTEDQASRSGTIVESTVPSFLGAEFDKGDGVGLKSFTLEFNGTNPAEARNDVKGTMTLFFQSFADFVRERVSYNGDTFSYVDLIVQPKPDDDNKIQGQTTQSLRQYDPSFYRIMVETGYNVPDNVEGIGTDLSNLQAAIKNMNKSFYLCMIDHSFNIKNDGTVEVSLTYRAYVETALKSLRYDALVTPELAKQRIINKTKLFELAMSEECTIDQLADVKALTAAIETEILQKSLNSIMTRLQKNDKIFTCLIDNNHRRQFLDNGYFRKCDIISDVSNLNNNTANANTGDLGVVLNTRLPESSDDFDFNDADKNDTIVQYFFFGDLLYTILDSLYVEDNKGKARGLANTMIVLGSFDFEVFQKEQGSGNLKSFNISHIPISVEFFSRWFVDNVLNKKSTRKSFPILNFIRSLSNALVSNAMLEACVNRDIEQRLIFQTGQFSSYSGDAKDKIGQLIDLNMKNAILDTDESRSPPTVEGGETAQPAPLPLEGSPAGDSKIENFFHYIILNPNGSTRSHKGVGDYALDIGSGVFHVEIGSNRGLVKTVQFSKTDLQYIREARFMRNGVDGLLQLSSVYSVSIEMFGNTLFYPGMDLWLNPYGFGGTALGHPSTRTADGKRSLANALGIGGYHTITSVSTTLTPNSFTTSIKAQHYYSGDGEVGSIQPKTSVPKGLDEQLIEMGIPEESQTGTNLIDCKREIVHLQDVGRGAVVGELQPRAYIPQEEIEAQTSAPAPSAPAAAPAPNSSNSSATPGPGIYDVNGVEFSGDFVLEADGSMSFDYTDAAGIPQTIPNAG